MPPCATVAVWPSQPHSMPSLGAVSSPIGLASGQSMKIKSQLAIEDILVGDLHSNFASGSCGHHGTVRLTLELPQ